MSDKNTATRRKGFGCAYFLLPVLLLLFLLPIPARASQTKTVRVGHYENEVFQEGAREGRGDGERL